MRTDETAPHTGETIGRRALSLIPFGAVATAIGISVGIVLAPMPIPPSAQVPDPYLRADVVLADYDDARTVPVSVISTSALELLSPSTGTMTAITCSPGATWASGSFPFAVDGTPKLFISTASPLYRDLVLGTRGDDVQALQQELVRLGYDSDNGGVVTQKTRRAIAAMYATSGQKIGGDLRLDAAIWVPTHNLEIEECPLLLGARLTTDSVIATTAGVIQLVQVTDVPAGLAAGERQLTVGDAVVLLDESLRSTDTVQLAELARTAAFDIFRRSEGDVPLTGKIELVEPVLAARVPPSALVTDADGANCLYSDGVANRVRILGSSLGLATVQFETSTIPDFVDVIPPKDAACT